MSWDHLSRFRIDPFSAVGEIAKAECSRSMEVSVRDRTTSASRSPDTGPD
jgi:hypothetical protein